MTKPQLVYIRPAVNPDPEAKGETYYTWHPSAFRKRIPAEGAWVPKDIFTMRYLKDGTWLLAEPPKEAASESPRRTTAAAARE